MSCSGTRRKLKGAERVESEIDNAIENNKDQNHLSKNVRSRGR